jgi:hypothetical protein
MAKPGKQKSSDAPAEQRKAHGKQGGKPAVTHDVAAEQLRAAKERARARQVVSSDRDRMVDFGRGNQQAGRGRS